MDKAERSTAPNRTPKDAKLIHFSECHRALQSVRGNERTGGMDGAVDIERNLCPVQAHIVRAQGSSWATGNGTNVPLNWLFKLAHLFGVANLSTIVLKPPTGHFLPGGQLQYEELRNSLTVLQPDLSTCINVHKISLECALKSIPHFIEQRRCGCAAAKLSSRCISRQGNAASQSPRRHQLVREPDMATICE